MCYKFITGFSLGSLAALAVLWAAQALCYAAGDPAEQALVADLTGGDQRGRAYGLYAMAAGLGAALGPLAGGWLYENILFLSYPDIDAHWMYENLHPNSQVPEVATDTPLPPATAAWRCRIVTASTENYQWGRGIAPTHHIHATKPFSTQIIL